MKLHNIKNMSNFLTRILTLFLAVATVSCKPLGSRNLVRPRIYGGSYAGRFQFPFIVSIGIHKEFEHVCGGSIINKKWVVTAAHCVNDYDAEDLFMTAGITDLGSPAFKYDVITVVVHSGFDPEELDNDIALLKNLLQFCFGPTVQKIPIGSVPPFQAVVTVGWGYFDERNMVSKRLKYAVMSTRHPLNCAAEGFTHRLSPGKLCVVGGGGDSPCKGDSGGPLTFGPNLVGVVSYMKNSCGSMGPYVYTDLAYYKDWIEKEIEGCLC